VRLFRFGVCACVGSFVRSGDRFPCLCGWQPVHKFHSPVLLRPFMGTFIEPFRDPVQWKKHRKFSAVIVVVARSCAVT
jgi:hypothetical protein